MKFEDYKNLILKINSGKKTKSALYLHSHNIQKTCPNLYEFIEKIRPAVKKLPNYNVLKFMYSEFKMSFLTYSNFFKIPHPILKNSISIDFSTGKIRDHK